MTLQRRASHLVIGLFCMTALALTGCQGKIQPKLTLKPGDSRTLRIKSDLTQTITMMGQEQKVPQNMTLAFGFDVESVDASGVATVKVTCKEGDLPGMGDMGAMAGQMGDMGDLSNLSLTGQSFTMVLRPDGKVDSVEGMNKVVDDLSAKAYEAAIKMFENNPMMAQMAAGGGEQQMAQIKDAMKDMMKKMMREQMGDEATREQMESMFWVYPETPLAVGDQWTKTRILYKGKPMIVNETYTLKERKDGALLVDFKSQITPNDSAKPMEIMMGMQMKMAFNGEQSGNLKIDEATGWLLGGTIKQKLTGNMDMGVMAMPMTLEGTVTIESE